MNSNPVRTTTVLLGVLASAFLTLAFLPPLAGATLYSQFVLESQFGRQVNLTETDNHGGEEKEDICVAKTSDTCQPGVVGRGSGAFASPEGIVVGSEAAGNDIYVADRANARVQVFSPDEKFLFMFGWEVDKTTKANTCTKTSGDECQAGQPVNNGSAGELKEPMSIAVDETGDIYVDDFGHRRVVKYDPEGKFIWMVGGNVNKTKTELNGTVAERNLCTAESGDQCQSGQENAEGSKVPGAFRPGLGGDVITISGVGSELALYVGDQGRVQKLNPANGAWTGEVSLASLPMPDGYVKALAVGQDGKLYVVVSELPGGTGTGVNVLEASGSLLNTIDPGRSVLALALDPFGRIAVTEPEQGEITRGKLFATATGEKLSVFQTSFESSGVAFNPDNDEAKDQLYATNGQMVEQLSPVAVAKVITGPSCKNQTATSVTLTGQINPEAVSETTAEFLFGNPLVPVPPAIPIATGTAFVPVEATVSGLRPNESYPYVLTAEDEHYKPGIGKEPLSGELLGCETLYVEPLVANEAQSYYVGFSSADLYGELNPENADTTYRFEYGACGPKDLDECPETHRTPPLESSEYRTFGVMQSASGLQPATTYHYRLYAESENRSHTQTGSAHGNEGSFTTLPAPLPSASTGPASSVSSSSAVLSGNVDPGGASATWSFQVGVYNPAGTVFTTVVSGATGTEAGTEAQEYLLSGLQPGTTYAYRIVVQSAYTPGGEPLAGDTVLFTTQGLPTVLFAPTVLPMLAVPPIAFPKEPAKVTLKKLTRAQKLANALKACAKKPKRKRAACRRSAHRNYGAKAKAKKKKK